MINKNWSFRRGDIYLADLGEHHGHIQGGTRPVVVVQNDYGNRFAPTLIVVPLTTEIKKADMPTHYILRHQRGLDKPCMALSEPDSHHQQVPNHPLFRSCSRYSYVRHSTSASARA